MSLRERQVLFLSCLWRLLAYAEGRSYELTLAEGYVGDSIDKPGEDTPHLRRGGHFSRTAVDLNLFVNGEWIASDHLAWHDLGDYWKSLDPECRWGGDFEARDYNHFSVINEQGVA